MAAKFPWCFKDVSKEFEGSLESVSRVFQEKDKRCYNFKGVSKKVLGCFKTV